MMTKEQEQFTLSALIGDGYISKEGRLVLDHSVKQFDYLKKKQDAIESLFNVKLNPYFRAKKNTKCVYLDRKALFLPIRNKTYISGKKLISHILNNIEDKKLALILWLCDDAAINKSAIKLCICDSDKNEIKKIIKWFEVNFHVTSYVRYEKHENKSYPFLIFHQFESMVLFTYLKDYISNLPSMQYKFRNLISKYNAKYSKLENSLPTRPRTLTIRFRNKLEYTDNEIILIYNELNTVKDTAKRLNCTEQLLKNILIENNALHPKGYKRG